MGFSQAICNHWFHAKHAETRMCLSHQLHEKWDADACVCARVWTRHSTNFMKNSLCCYLRRGEHIQLFHEHRSQDFLLLYWFPLILCERCETVHFICSLVTNSWSLTNPCGGKLVWTLALTTNPVSLVITDVYIVFTVTVHALKGMV